MTTAWIAVLVLAAPPAEPTTGEAKPAASVAEDSAPAADSPFRRAFALKCRVSQALRNEATTDGDAHEAAVLELLAVYRDLTGTNDLAKDERIRLHALVRSRLTQVAKRIGNEVKRRQAIAAKPKLDAPTNLGDPAKAIADDAPASGAASGAYSLDRSLRQIGEAIGHGGATEPLGESLLELIKTTIRPASWEDNGGSGSIRLWRTGSLRSGLRQLGTGAVAQARQGLAAADRALGGGSSEDHGEALVDLIQATIAPNTWDVNGGFGSIYYFRSLRVLVVRTTGEVHGQVGGVINNLRAAGP